MFHDNDFLMTTPMIKFNDTMITNEHDRKVLIDKKKEAKKAKKSNNNGNISVLRRFNFNNSDGGDHNG